MATTLKNKRKGEKMKKIIMFTMVLVMALVSIGGCYYQGRGGHDGGGGYGGRDGGPDNRGGGHDGGGGGRDGGGDRDGRH